MLGILLMILKVIGLFFLGVLGLLLALFVLVLLLPVPYHVWVSGDTADPDQLAYRIKIFGIQLLPKKERRRRKAKHGLSKKQTPEEALLSAGEQPENLTRQLTDDSGQTGERESTVSQQTTNEQPKTESRQDENNNKQKQKRQKAGKKDAKNSSGKDVRAIWDRVRSELSDESNHRAIRHVFSEIRYLLSHFGPRRVRADVSFSLGDPANTGYATALLSVCPFSYGRDTRILPDFEIQELYLRGWLDVRGHVRMIHVLITGIRLLFDKDIRNVLKKVLKKK